jgi:hypothetical protein
MTQLGSTERYALMKAADVKTLSDDRKSQEEIIRKYLAKFEPVRDRLSDEAEKFRSGNRSDRADDHQRTQENDDMGSKKKAAKGGKGKLKAAAPKVKAAANGEAKAEKDGLGREGTPARYIREAILKGSENEKIATDAAKKFDNAKIDNKYVGWYRTQMRKAGLIQE